MVPTADGRDAWLSTMRTIGLEGRCFVVSSNMCVRNKPSEQATTTTTTAAPSTTNGDGIAQDPVVASGEPVNGIPETHPRGGGRRNSCYTEEGFEIALPDGGSEGVGVGGPSRTAERRRSVFDEDGHEIVLCSRDGAGQTVIEEEAQSQSQQQQNGIPPAKKAQQQQNGTAGFVSRGGSCIVSPFGDVLAGPQWEDDEGVIYADVDFDDCVRGRLDLDVGGSYSRNDSFKFSVDGLEFDPLPYY